MQIQSFLAWARQQQKRAVSWFACSKLVNAVLLNARWSTNYSAIQVMAPGHCQLLQATCIAIKLLAHRFPFSFALCAFSTDTAQWERKREKRRNLHHQHHHKQYLKTSNTDCHGPINHYPGLQGYRLLRTLSTPRKRWAPAMEEPPRWGQPIHNDTISYTLITYKLLTSEKGTISLLVKYLT